LPFENLSGDSLKNAWRNFALYTSNRRFQFRNRNQLIIRAHNAPLPVAAMGVSNPDCSPFTIHR
jgi:hypothetical protein